MTRLNTNGRMLTSMMCKDLRAASLDAVQITFYSAEAEIHNQLVGVDGYNDTLNGIHNALAADLNVSLNTPLCSLNRDYLSVVKLAHTLGIRYLTCSGLIPAGNADTAASRAVRLTPAELEENAAPRDGVRRRQRHRDQLYKPRLAARGYAAGARLYPDPQLRCLPVQYGHRPGRHGPACQSWLSGKGLGNLLRTPWPRIWHSHECHTIREESAKMAQRCQLGDTPMQEGCR